ncbi:MAG: DUF1844 domain-containing protein [Nitrospirota bacterium]
MAEEEKGFIIRDRRGAGAEPEEKAAPAQSPPPQAEPPKGQPAPPINFLSFIYSMGTSALMYLGEPLGPGAGGETPNLSHAKEIIDVLTMLEAKTKGNLTGEEEALLEEMLYTLRIKFVEKAKAPKV